MNAQNRDASMFPPVTDRRNRLSGNIDLTTKDSGEPDNGTGFRNDFEVFKREPHSGADVFVRHNEAAGEKLFVDRKSQLVRHRRHNGITDRAQSFWIGGRFACNQRSAGIVE